MAIAPGKLAGRQAGWGICVSDMNRVLKCNHSWEEKLAENQMILLLIQYKSPRESRRRGAMGWEKQTTGGGLGRHWGPEGSDPPPSGQMEGWGGELRWSRE